MAQAPGGGGGGGGQESLLDVDVFQFKAPCTKQELLDEVMRDEPSAYSEFDVYQAARAEGRASIGSDGRPSMTLPVPPLPGSPAVATAAAAGAAAGEGGIAVPDAVASPAAAAAAAIMSTTAKAAAEEVSNTTMEEAAMPPAPPTVEQQQEESVMDIDIPDPSELRRKKRNVLRPKLADADVRASAGSCLSAASTVRTGTKTGARSSGGAATRDRRASSLLRPTSASSAKRRARSVPRGRGSASFIPTPAPARPPSLTQPTSPKFHAVVHHANGPHHETFEEKQVKEMELGRARLKQQLQRNKMTLQRTLHSAKQPECTMRSTKQLTMPQSPQTTLSKRYGVKKYAAQGRDTTGAAAEQQQQQKKQEQHTGEPTQPKPFMLRTQTRAASRGRSRPSPSRQRRAETTGESIQRMQTRVPDRFLSRAPAANQPELPAKEDLHLTQAVAPRLHTEMRARVHGGPRVLSQAEIEEQQMQEAHKHRFRARPINPHIFDSAGDYGVPKTTSAKTTEPEPFAFASESRAYFHSRAASTQAVEQKRQSRAKPFRARPMPDFSKDGLGTNNEQHEPKPLTQPFSPKFATKARAAIRGSSAPPRTRPAAKNSNEPAENNAPLTLTEPEPFSLSTSQRGELHEANMDAQRRLQEMQESQAAQVRARPLPASTFEKKFEIVHEERSPLRPMTVNLHTDHRAPARQMFDKMMEKHMQELETERKQRLQEQEAAELEEVQRQRQAWADEGGMCFKARSVQREDEFRCRKPIVERPLTEPNSPMLRTKVRSSMRNMMASNDAENAQPF